MKVKHLGTRQILKTQQPFASNSLLGSCSNGRRAYARRWKLTQKASPTFLEKGRQVCDGSHGTSILSEAYDRVSYDVEYIRSWMFNPVIYYTKRLVQFGRRVVYPTSQVEDNLKKVSLYEGKGLNHSLLIRRLSLYDTFGAEGGVPGYRLCKPFTSTDNGKILGSSIFDSHFAYRLKLVVAKNTHFPMF